MKTGSAVPRLGFRSRDRAMGIAGAWTAFVVNEAYAITSGLGYLSVEAPSDAISDPYLSIMSLLIVLMAPFLVITMVAVHTYAAAEHKPEVGVPVGVSVLARGGRVMTEAGLLVNRMNCVPGGGGNVGVSGKIGASVGAWLGAPVSASVAGSSPVAGTSVDMAGSVPMKAY